MIDSCAFLVMVLLCAAWGLQQVAIKALAGDVSTLLQTAVAAGGGAALVWIFHRFVARDAWIPGLALGPGALVGLLYGTEFVFIAEALRFTTASHVVVFLYTAPLFAAVGLHLRHPDERLAVRQWIGIGLAFTGIAVAFFGPHVASGALFGDLLAVCAGAAWGITTVVIRLSRLGDAPPSQPVFYQLAGGFAVLVPTAMLTKQLHFRPTLLVLTSLSLQAVLVCFVSYLVWCWLLTRYRAAPLGILSFMTPLFGVGFGALLLGEEPTLAFLAGAVLVLTGLAVVSVVRKEVSP